MVATSYLQRSHPHSWLYLRRKRVLRRQSCCERNNHIHAAAWSVLHQCRSSCQSRKCRTVAAWCRLENSPLLGGYCRNFGCILITLIFRLRCSWRAIAFKCATTSVEFLLGPCRKLRLIGADNYMLTRVEYGIQKMQIETYSYIYTLSIITQLLRKKNKADNKDRVVVYFCHLNRFHASTSMIRVEDGGVVWVRLTAAFTRYLQRTK